MKSTKYPDSDTRARHRQEDITDETAAPPPEDLQGRQTSTKAGSRSTVEKLAASRSEFAPRPSAGPVSGAFDGDAPQPSGTGEFRCSACGRYFDVESDLRAHEVECRVAKEATHLGAQELAKQDATPHAPNDRDK